MSEIELATARGLPPGAVVTEHTPSNGQVVIECPNGYSASIIRNAMSYGHQDGLYELAVLRGGRIVYDTPITGDVIGWLTPADAVEIVHQIAALPPRRTELPE